MDETLKHYLNFMYIETISPIIYSRSDWKHPLIMPIKETLFIIKLERGNEIFQYHRQIYFKLGNIQFAKKIDESK